MSNFSGVAKTLFIPLTARIYVSKRFPNYFYDEKCLEIEKLIPMELLNIKSNQYQNFANVSCFFNMDKIVRDFIENNGECNIVNLGCGLETNYYRIKDDRATFYELDLPEVIENRRKVLGETSKDICLPYSMFDLKWCSHIDKNKPTLITARGVFEYFEVDKIVELLKQLSKEITNAEVVFDSPNSKALGYTNRYVKKTGNDDARIKFFIDDDNEFANKVNAELLSSSTFFKETRRVVKKGLSLYTKIAMRVVDKNKLGKIIRLRLL